MSNQINLPSKTHLVVIPSYNTGPILKEVVQEALAYWAPIWIVVDGSTDGSEEPIWEMAKTNSDLKVLKLPENRGKGSAVLHALDVAAKHSFTHVLCMDSDGQHPASRIRDIMITSMDNPECMVLGKPIFDDSAPAARVHGRKLSNIWVHIETLFAGIGDSLFGFKLYPIAPLRKIMHNNYWGRRFDFDPEANVRMVWAGVKPINLPCRVRYIRREEGGISHFNYLRDNILLTWMHFRLLITFLVTKLVLAPFWRF